MNVDYPCRKLRKLSSQTRPEHLLFIDTETKTQLAKQTADGVVIASGWDEILYDYELDVIEQHRLKIGWTCFCKYEKGRGLRGDIWYLWRDTKRLWTYVTQLATSKTPLFIFGHNIFFDLQVSDFFYYLTLWGWTLDFVYDKGLVYILIIRKGRKCIKCISTTNYFPAKLEEVGTFLGVPKLSIDFNKCSEKELIRYCKRDTLILRKLINHYLLFIDKHDLGKFHFAKGGQAFGAYRYRFMNKAIYPHSNEKVQELELKAYGGARTECKFLGKVKGNSFVALDVNSLYGYVMKKNEFPKKLIHYVEYPTLDMLSNALKSFCVIAKVQIDTNETAYLKHYQFKAFFPLGRFEAYLCTEGLRYALKHNHIFSIIEMAVYEKVDLFSEYVDYFAALKEKYAREKNSIMRHFAKDILNSLYGKFAQRRDVLVSEYRIDYKGYYKEQTYDTILRRTETLTKMFNKVWITYGSEFCSNSFIAISAHVTEYARFYLYKIMKQVGIDNVLYTDTDSLKIRTKHLPKLKKYIHPYKLGMLKIEDRFKEFEIYGAKYYRTEKELKIKGVPHNAKKIGKYKYQYTSFLKQSTHLRAQVTRFSITQQVVKVVKPFYNKGIVLKSGRIIPITFKAF